MAETRRLTGLIAQAAGLTTRAAGLIASMPAGRAAGVGTSPVAGTGTSPVAGTGTSPVAGTGVRRRRAVVLAGAGALAAGLVVAGCSLGPAAVRAGGSCGTMRTAANVLVTIKVTKGAVDCSAALGVERGYAAMIAKGDVPGNGGGAPVPVNGWTCQGYPTPQVLRTGDASACHTAYAEVVAVLALPASGS